MVMIDLKLARRIAGLTQTQLAKRAGVEKAIICRLEKLDGPRRRPSFECAYRLATALNLEPTELFALSTGSMPKKTPPADKGAAV